MDRDHAECPFPCEVFACHGSPAGGDLDYLLDDLSQEWPGEGDRGACVTAFQEVAFMVASHRGAAQRNLDIGATDGVERAGRDRPRRLSVAICRGYRNALTNQGPLSRTAMVGSCGLRLGENLIYALADEPRHHTLTRCACSRHRYYLRLHQPGAAKPTVLFGGHASPN
jgi:hypothetical protein